MRTETPQQVELSEYTPYSFRIETVSLVFCLEPEATQVTAKMQVTRVSGTNAQEPMRLDGKSLVLKSLMIDGKTVDDNEYALTEDSLTLNNVPGQFTLETVVEINPAANTALSGLYISGGRFCTQCEATGFRHITFWPDRPDVMSRFHVRIEAERTRYPVLLSNGSPATTGELANGRHFAEWDDPHPKPSYLFALCAGDYDVLTDRFTTRSGRDVSLGIHVDKGEAGRATWAMESLKNSMRWDEDMFGREYDLDVFNIVAVRDFNFGAMENKGLNIFNSAYVLADEETATDADFEAIESIVGHEYFHNWTGNRITCRDWFQLCLKEGLTVFRDQEFSADMRSRPVQRIKDVIRLRARQFPEDAGPLAHSVRPATYGSIDNLYTATVYEKGAELIRMLKILIGDEAFASGMAFYFDHFDGTAATIEDFYSCFEEASDQSLEAFRAWYAQAGTPELAVVEEWDEGEACLTVTLHQSTPPTPGQETKNPLPIPVRMAVLTHAGERLHARTVLLDSATMRVPFKLAPGTTRPLLSVNRGFSAPVRVKRDMRLDDRLALARFDDDTFCQWDMLQTLLKEDILAIAYGGANSASLQLVRTVSEATLRASKSDPAFAALLMRPPATGELFLEHTPVDAAELVAARKIVERAVAAELENFCLDLLEKSEPAPFKPDAEQAGIRALRTVAMSMLGALGKTSELTILFNKAASMTESLSALKALADNPGDAYDMALASFYARWQSAPLVIDKWFSVQAMTGDAASVSALLKHEDFDLTNPNRVRAVAGAFAAHNPEAFHAMGGSGYRLVAGIIAEADKLNPALAAGLATSFEQWRVLEPVSRASAEGVLKQLQDSQLSQNSADIIARALG